VPAGTGSPVRHAVPIRTAGSAVDLGRVGTYARSMQENVKDVWFGVRCVFRHGESTYEERIVIVRAADFAHAIAKAEDEAAEYADDVDAEYVGLAQAYALSDDLGDGAEVFSLMRDSDLGPDDYLDAFFSTGDERENDVGPSQDFVGPTQ
jgi:hypothetical protein